VFAVQLALNAIWTPIFFGFDRYGLALVDIVLLWVLIGVTVLLFRPVSRLAAALLLPYRAWVTFATDLNAAMWCTNWAGGQTGAPNASTGWWHRPMSRPCSPVRRRCDPVPSVLACTGSRSPRSPVSWC
jgi:hypothetical protein